MLITWILRLRRKDVLRILSPLNHGEASVIVSALRSLHYIFLIILLFHVIASLKFKRLMLILTPIVYFISSCRIRKQTRKKTGRDNQCYRECSHQRGRRAQVVSAFILFFYSSLILPLLHFISEKL